MQRRQFLSLIGASALAPVLPAPSFGTGVVQAGYTRYMYGLAVFHARTKGAVTACDLAARLGVTGPQASAMVREMTTRGIVSATTGALRTATPALPRKPYVRRILRQITNHTDAQNNGAVRAAHLDTNPALNRITTDAPTSGDYSDE